MQSERNPGMSPSLAAALEEAAALAATRGWTLPGPQAIAEAERLLALVQSRWRPPVVQVQPGGEISLEWESGSHGWLRLTVAAAGTVQHSAVIEGDEYELAEPFGDAVPPWAQELLQRLLGAEH